MTARGRTAEPAALLAEHRSDYCEHEFGGSCPDGCPPFGYCLSSDHQEDVAPDWPCEDVLPALGVTTREAWTEAEMARLDALYIAQESAEAPARLCRCGHPEAQHTPSCHGISQPVGSTPPGFQPRTERCRCLAFDWWEDA